MILTETSRANFLVSPPEEATTVVPAKRPKISYTSLRGSVQNRHGREEKLLAAGKGRSMDLLSRLSSFSSDGSCTDGPDNEIDLLADSFLAQCETSETTSSSGEEEDDRLSGIGSPQYFKFLNKSPIDNEKAKILRPRGEIRAPNSETRDFPKISPTTECFLRHHGIALPGEAPLEPEYRNIILARRAHGRVRTREFKFESLKLISNKVSKEQSESSFFGMFFHKMASWTGGEDQSHIKKNISLPVSDTSSNPGLNEAYDSKVDSSSADFHDESSPQLGLQRSSVARLENYDKELRKDAQNMILGGRRNVAFIDKVQILEIPGRKVLPKYVREKMFYSKSQFLRMIGNNMREIELEVRRQMKRKRRKEAARIKS